MGRVGGGQFFWRLYLSYTALVVVSAIAIGRLVLGNLKEMTVRDFTQNLLGTARLLAATAAANPAHLWSPQLALQVDDVAAETGLHLTYLLANGRILAETSPHVDGDGPALGLPEIRDARTKNTGVARRMDPGTGAEYLLVAAPILFEYEILGYVRAGMPLTGLAEREDNLRDRVIIGASLGAAAALLFGFVFTRSVTRPLESIVATCRRIASGHLGERVELARTDEFGIVATTVNHMAGELQRRIDEESRERQRLAALLSAMTDGVVAISARGTIAYANGVAARLLHIDADAHIGAPFESTVGSTAVVAVYREAIANASAQTSEIRITGHPYDRVLAIYATPLHDRAGVPRGALVVLHDLSEIRRLEEVRQKFSANVSHELKTPLAAIGSLLDAMLDDPEMAQPVRERFLGRVRDQTDRLQSLVQDLLTLSRLESEREVLELSKVHAGTLIAPCMKTFAPIAAQKRIALETEIGGDSLWMRVNEQAGRLVVSNLLQNAIHYTPEGGRVVVALSRTAAMVTIEVRDTGIGIAPDHLERIFERFYRVDAARSRQAGGTGLGLAIVKHLTVAMGGHVFVESTPGEGSVFRVQFRAADAPDR